MALQSALAAGQVTTVNDLVTRNIDLNQFAHDVIALSEGPDVVRAFYEAIQRVSILDPACGSGAFLFAALSVLEPLYEACFDRMEAWLEDLERVGQPAPPDHDFRRTLDRVAQHPSRKYFILKSVIVGNLFGVDILPEAVEICKLRLFLKLVSQIEVIEDLEPLPDIDFNVKTGNAPRRVHVHRGGQSCDHHAARRAGTNVAP